jgi:hypothetical protein
MPLLGVNNDYLILEYQRVGKSLQNIALSRLFKLHRLDVIWLHETMGEGKKLMGIFINEGM